MTKLLFYRWGAVREDTFKRALLKKNIQYVKFQKKMVNYHADADFAMEFMNVIHGGSVSIVFSFDYFPLISSICEINKIPYISWVYDCPLGTLFSPTIENKMNFIFCFDRKYTEILRNRGGNCFYYPLVGDAENLIRIIEDEQNNIELSKKYACDISFVGNLYNKKMN